MKGDIRPARDRRSHLQAIGPREAAAAGSQPSNAPPKLLRTPSGSSLERALDEIERLSLDELRTRWRNATGRLAPAHLQRGLLAKLLAYRLQAQAFGDLDRISARALARWNDEAGQSQIGEKDAPVEAGVSAKNPSAANQRQPSAPLILRTGTLLTREWEGRMETVMVVAGGFAWNGKTFGSLSAVAKAITGTKWNGHRFFGVRPQDRSSSGGVVEGDGGIDDRATSSDSATTGQRERRESPAKATARNSPSGGAGG
jgi:hypothetical protein